jgi:hypothetical protein
MSATPDPALKALGELLAAYAEIDQILDAFASSDPEGMTPKERGIQLRSNAARDRVLTLYQRLTAGGNHA